MLLPMSNRTSGVGLPVGCHFVCELYFVRWSCFVRMLKLSGWGLNLVASVYFANGRVLVCYMLGVMFFISILLYLSFFGMLPERRSAILVGLLMDHKRPINIPVWNIRGINCQGKWDALRDKISESDASTVSLQETKHETSDAANLKKFYPRHLNNFAFFPSVGASEGLIVIWNSNLFNGTLVDSNSNSVSIKFECCLSGHFFTSLISMDLPMPLI